MILLALTCPFMYWVDQRAREHKGRLVGICLMIMFIITLISIALRGREFYDVHFRWDDNAYASFVWAILFMHLIYLLGAAGEFFIMGLWALRHRLDEKHGLDVTLAGGYQYWLVGIWVPCYVTVFWYPRWT
jgi:cytochrome c oxidase subunit I+III